MKGRWNTAIQVKKQAPPLNEKSTDKTVIVGGCHIELEESSQQVTDFMADLQTILDKELRDFRQENSGALREIKEDIKITNSRVDEADL